MAWGRGAGGEGERQSPTPQPLSPAHLHFASCDAIAGRRRGEGARPRFGNRGQSRMGWVTSVPSSRDSLSA